MTGYQFTNDWFGTTANLPHWEAVFEQLKPVRCLEIGSYEGRSAAFMIKHLPALGNMTCVDTWAGGHDLTEEAMRGVEARFDANMKLALAQSKGPFFRKMKAPSNMALAKLMADEERFDFIYIDGMHTAPNVLTDGVMAYQILNPNGIMIFDDYLWRMDNDVLNAPGFAIDTFATMFARSMTTIAIGGQRVFQKVAE